MMLQYQVGQIEQGLPGAPVAHPGLAVAADQVVLREAGAQQRMRVHDEAGQPLVELRVGLGGVDLAPHHLAVGPCQVEDAVGQPAHGVGGGHQAAAAQAALQPFAQFMGLERVHHHQVADLGDVASGAADSA